MLKNKTWIYVSCLLTLSINFTIYLLFLNSAWGGNSLILSYSLVFLFVNLFLVIPLGFPLYFPLGVSKKMKYRLTEETSSLKNLVFITKTAQFAYANLFKLIWGVGIIAFPISLTNYFFGQEKLIFDLAYPMAFSILGTALLLFHTIPFASVMGYPSLWRLFVRGERSLNERLNEARMFLSFSTRLLEKNYKEGITLLANSLLIINKAMIEETMWATPRRMKNLDTTLIMLEAIEKTDRAESKKDKIRGVTKKISKLINENRLNDIPVTLHNFVEEKELESFKGWPPKRFEISNRFVSTLLITAAALSAVVLKILEIAALQYPQLFVFLGITSVFAIISYLYIYRSPAIPYPLAFDVLSALGKKIQNSNNP